MGVHREEGETEKEVGGNGGKEGEREDQSKAERGRLIPWK